MRKGLRASNEQDDFCEAARCFSTLLQADSLDSSSCDAPQEQQPVQSQEEQQRVRDALFNMASLLHMHGHVALALPLLLRLLQMGDGGSDTDMTTHAFLWSLARGCCLLPEEEEQAERDRERNRGESEPSDDSTSTAVFLRGLVVEVYHSLACGGDVLATHKYRALTGHDYTSDSPEQQGQQESEKGKGKGDPQYAALIFDHMAPEFERRLVKDLQYDCPWRMKQLLGTRAHAHTPPRTAVPSALLCLTMLIVAHNMELSS